jgi:hypothetical protein
LIIPEKAPKTGDFYLDLSHHLWLLVSKSLYSHLLHSLFDNKEDMLDMDPDSAIHAVLTALAEQVYPDA